MLFQSYAESFKKFSPLTQAKLKLEIAKLFSNAEISEIKNRIISNEYYSNSSHSNVNSDMQDSPASTAIYITEVLSPSPSTNDYPNIEDNVHPSFTAL